MDAVIESFLRKKTASGMSVDEVLAFAKKTNLFERVGRSIAKAAREEGPSYLAKLHLDRDGMLRQRHLRLERFERQLRRTWKKPLDYLEMLVVMAAETGELMSSQWKWQDSAEASLIFDVLRRLQARGCQLACEVLSLLQTGHAPGAHARWRSLHETTVTAMFIKEHGAETARRYLAHECVEAFRAAESFQDHCRRLRQTPYRQAEMQEFKKRFDDVVERYGRVFATQYGWAAEALNRADGRFGFREIEAAVRLDHLRPYYRMASHPVHANPKAIRFSLSLPSGRDVLLTGPSPFGLTDPGHSTAISLHQLTVTMLTMLPGFDSIMIGTAMGNLVDQIGDAFIEALREQRVVPSKRRSSGRQASRASGRARGKR